MPKSSFEYFIRTNFTASAPVCLPSVIFSPIPTPTTFSVGDGLMAVVTPRRTVA